MHDTAYTERPWFEGRIAVPTDVDGKALQPVFAKTFVASDLLYSTPSDYAKFMLSVMVNQGLSPAIATERNKIQVRHRADICPASTAEFCPKDLGFGLGWELYQYQDGPFMMHTGSDDGVFTFGYLNPEKRSGIIIFTNSANGGRIILPLLESLQIDSHFVKYLKATVGK